MTVMVVVIAILVVVMVITVMIVIGMIVTVMVTTMIARSVRVRLRFMRMAAGGIGAAFGIERRLDLDDAGAEPLHHRLDDMISANAQALRHNLRRQMTVAEVPGDPDQMMRIAALDLDQRLGCGNHLDQAAVFQHQRIAAAQRDRMFEIEQELKPAGADHRHPPPVAIVEIEHDGIDRRLAPAILTADLRGADHGETLAVWTLAVWTLAVRTLAVWALTVFRPCRR